MNDRLHSNAGSCTSNPVTIAAAAGTRRWLADHAPALANIAAARVHAAALAAVCACADGSEESHRLYVQLHSLIGSEERSKVDPLTAALSDGRGQDTDLTSSPESLLELLKDGQSARQAVARIEASSNYGTRKIDTIEPCAMVLQGMALAAAKSFDWIFALRCARASAYCAPIGPAFRQTMVDFVRFAQDSDGSFIPPTALAEDCRSWPELAFVLQCAASLQALWTLKEFTQPGCRLINDVTMSSNRSAGRELVTDVRGEEQRYVF